MRWVVAAADAAGCESLAKSLGILPITAQVLINRGRQEVDSARAFLSPQMNDLADPDLLPGMEAAVERILLAIQRREKVLVYGDYDVDGTAATALLVKFLRLAGLDVEYHVPHRIEDGYGLRRSAIESFKSLGIGLIITVDCGIGAVAEGEYLRQEGIDLIVTDHHEPGNEVVSACSGVGVAFKLAWAVSKRFSDGRKSSGEFRKFLLDSLGLVALGTVADIVPLVGENRVFARYGLQALGSSCGPGLRALMDCSRIQGRAVKASDIAFRLGPRLNAAGRMADATLAIDLMMTEDEEAARGMAAELDRHNRDRQRLQNETFEHAREMVLGQPDFEGRRAIVLAHDAWHAGVIGIVASKLVDEFGRPAAMIAIEGSVGKGSARSVPGFHLFNALEGFRDRMISFGGHAGAAGFQIAVQNIAGLDEHLNRAAADLPEELFQPSMEVDAEVGLGDVTDLLVAELETLAPHGQGNPRPLFVVRDVRVAGRPRLMGMKGQHISFYVSDGRMSLRAVGFGLGEEVYDAILAGAKTCSLVFSPKVDTWTGDGALELEIKDISVE